MDVWIVHTVLSSIRVAIVLLLLPQFLGARVPAMVKIVLTLSLAMLMGNIGTAHFPDDQTLAPPPQWMGCAFSEVAMGLVLGLGSLLAFSAFQFMGRLFDIQMGLGMGHIYDPSTEHSETVISSLLTQFSVVILFALNFHHHMLRSLAYSFEHMPVCGNAAVPLIKAVRFEDIGELLGIGFLMMAPYLMCFFVLDLVVCVIAQAAPQFNALLLNLGIKVGLGLLLLALTSGELQKIAVAIHQLTIDKWDALMLSVRPADLHPK